MPLGAPGSLVNNAPPFAGSTLIRRFLAPLEPDLGLNLGRYINSPLRRLLPVAPALVVTFVVSGAIHDAAVMLVTRSISFLIVPWFTALGLIVLLTSWLGLDNRRRAWAIRATINTLLVLSGLEVSLLAKRMFAFP